MTKPGLRSGKSRQWCGDVTLNFRLLALNARPGSSANVSHDIGPYISVAGELLSGSNSRVRKCVVH